MPSKLDAAIVADIRNTAMEPFRTGRMSGSRFVYSTVTDLARFLGWSTSVPITTAV